MNVWPDRFHWIRHFSIIHRNLLWLSTLYSKFDWYFREYFNIINESKCGVFINLCATGFKFFFCLFLMWLLDVMTFPIWVWNQNLFCPNSNWINEQINLVILWLNFFFTFSLVNVSIGLKVSRLSDTHIISCMFFAA